MCLQATAYTIVFSTKHTFLQGIAMFSIIILLDLLGANWDQMGFHMVEVCIACELGCMVLNRNVH